MLIIKFSRSLCKFICYDIKLKHLSLKMSNILYILGTITLIYLYKTSPGGISFLAFNNRLIKTGVKANEIFVNSLSAEEIRKQIFFDNEQQKIYNKELFDPIGNDSLVILVQVHDRLAHLKALIESLSEAQGISSVLLIFSHDIYYEPINKEVQKIKFCKVMQIFYPFSLQTHPDKFPGVDASDCLPRMSLEEAIAKQCKNVFYSDSYGHFRNAEITQVKHHWWWKLNFIFKKLRALNNYTGLVLLLEEDYYLAPDFIGTLKLMQNYSKEVCTDCSLLSLGFRFLYNYSSASGVFISKRTGDFGLAFNRTVWNEISQHSEIFCQYDDYNWDWTLRYIVNKIMPSNTLSIVMSASRVYHTGVCGIHHTSRKCEPNKAIEIFKNKLARAKLFPKTLRKLKKFISNDVLRNGGWGDPRDHALCMGML